jgi:predicted deacylase
MKSLLRSLTTALLMAVWVSAFATTAKGIETGAYLLLEGTVWETPYYVNDSGKAGPTVLVVGGVHGNEPAGTRAAEQIRHWPIVRGKLIVVPAANRPGLAAGTRFLPGVKSPHRDLNRNFPGENAEGELADALLKLVNDTKPSWVLDLHEGYEFNISHQPTGGKFSVGPFTITRFDNRQPSSQADSTAHAYRYREYDLL